MAYELKKPYTNIQRADFIVNYNHNKGLMIEETDDALFALLDNEIMEKGIPIINQNYDEQIKQKRKEQFSKEFFKTSLGWIRRIVNMKDGSRKDFLSDLLLQIKAGIELGVNVELITYSEPNFSNELTEEYVISLQQRKNATPEFIQECLNQTVTDFCGG